MSVYFIAAREIGRVKIGCAFDPWDRIAKLKTSSPVELSLEAVLAGSFEKERELHRQFAAHRIHGEWFTLCPEIEAAIAEAGVPVRHYEGPARNQKKKLKRLLEDNARIESAARRYERETEELIEKKLKLEREMLAEALRDFAALDQEKAA